jgi:hypothetical protein
VLCWRGPGHGMEGFSTRIRLNEAEEILYAESGFKFIDDFAKTIQLDFKDISNRDIQNKELISSIRLAIQSWLANNNGKQKV